MRCFARVISFRLLLISLLFFSGTLPVFTSEQQSSSTPVLEEATALSKQGCQHKAISRLRKFISLNPNLAKPHQLLGIILAVNGDTTSGIEELKTAIELDPSSPETWLNLAAVYQSQGSIDAAIAIYDDFLRRFSDSTMNRQIHKLRDSLFAETKSAFHGPTKLKNPWRSGNLAVFIDSQDPVVQDGLISSYDAILKEAFGQWSKNSLGLVKFTFVNNPEIADIKCSWLEHSDLTTIESGTCRFYRNEDGVVKCTIELLDTPWSPAIPQTDRRLRFICLHEIGHALGLSSHSFDPGDVMFYCVPLSNQPTKISHKNIQNLRRLYKSERRQSP